MLIDKILGMREPFSRLFFQDSGKNGRKQMLNLVKFRIRLVLVLVLCVGIVWTSGGCLRRRMTINSKPQGATVYVDGHQLGKTPVSTDFTYYGTRNIRLEMDNYHTMNVKQKVSPPWYEFPVFDFFTETFSANEIKNHHVWTYDLQPKAISSDDQIEKRAEAFAFEGSRIVNPDGSLGTPITAENYQNRRRPGVGENPDAGVGHMFPGNGGPTESLAPPDENSASMTGEFPENGPLSGNSSAIENMSAPNDPNAFPTGSADWDTPNRYPSRN